MTTRLLVCCDGTPEVRPTITLGRCRGFLPLRHTDGVHMDELRTAGWSRPSTGRHLCPACTHAAEQHTGGA
jgi:hypothetical protein